ncbi:MBL fold metallo-hydrolase [Rhizohabitans arisaemae]|uniref:MBL fold metallo-hydrolase n=1 Tax=Rhizohabitans arisaemae TaxID=2720610 RepID=UPI0024B117B4|nr:MBL fold metallo-hydrolase [Rhizohabitans arisaemae]
MLRLTLVRHATLLIEIAGRTLLVDPMLDDLEAQPPVPGTFNPQRYPLVPLPEDAAGIVSRADAAVITHRHVDHLDGTAIDALLARGVTVFCQPLDEAPLRDLGFKDVRSVHDTTVWEGIELTRTGGRHGTGELADLMAPVSGFVLRAEEHGVYVAGDTVWCDEVRHVLNDHVPTVVVVNAGEARMLEGDPITMDAADVIAVARHASGRVVAVHMEALNHCVLTRKALAAAVRSAGVDVDIPADGETIVFDAG